MSMFPKKISYHLWEKLTIREWPIRRRQPGIVARHQRTRDNQKKRSAGDQQRKTRNSLDCEGSIFPTNREEWMFQNANIRLHPRMLITLDRDQNLGTCKRLLDWRRAIWLRLIPFLIDLRGWVYVVLSGIAVYDL